MTPEKQFENKVKKFLIGLGVYEAGTPEHEMQEVPPVGWFFKTWGGGYQRKGIPDLLMCVNGMFISVETKAPRGTATDLQKKNTRMINRGNGIGIILYPDGFDQFKNIVKGVIQCKHHIPEVEYLKVANTGTSCNILTR